METSFLMGLVARAGNIEAARLLLDHGADIFAEDDEEMMLLFSAAIGGHL